MTWKEVGGWIRENAGTGAALVGSLLAGNVPGAVAAGISIVSSATGTDDPDKALSSLSTNPEALLKLKDLYFKNEESIRQHLEKMTELDLQDKQKEQEQTQETIRSGDNAADEYVRHTRPGMARKSYYGGFLYCIGLEAAKAFGYGPGADWTIASLLFSPALAYMGFRTWDKIKGFDTQSIIPAVLTRKT